MHATVSVSVAMWVCPHDPTVVVPIGALTLPEVDEPAVADGEIRWFSDWWGVGAIADARGDVWVHFSVIEMPGYKTLVEGQRVEYETTGSPQGAFRSQARFVRPIEMEG